MIITRQIDFLKIKKRLKSGVSVRPMTGRVTIFNMYNLYESAHFILFVTNQ